ncbi:hypothetical protein HQ533_06375 [Candidatus Woesearchaeota archaeon]|nr:hypothetical protein [Candidatus Woesearchaeota archaeon]
MGIKTLLTTLGVITIIGGCASNSDDIYLGSGIELASYESDFRTAGELADKVKESHLQMLAEKKLPFETMSDGQFMVGIYSAEAYNRFFDTNVGFIYIETFDMINSMLSAQLESNFIVRNHCDKKLRNERVILIDAGAGKPNGRLDGVLILKEFFDYNTNMIINSRVPSCEPRMAITQKIVPLSSYGEDTDMTTSVDDLYDMLIKGMVFD